jgi:hypothetical protein
VSPQLSTTDVRASSPLSNSSDNTSRPDKNRVRAAQTND